MINKCIWKKFLLNLKKGDYAAIFRALIYFGFKILGLVLVLPAIVVLWILKPFVWVKVGKLHNKVIGALAQEPDLFLRRCQLGIFPDGPFYFFICDSRNVANRQLLKMFKRVMRICESRVLVALYDGIFPVLKNTPFFQPLVIKYNE